MINVLVLCDNPAILRRAFPIFKKQKGNIILTNSDDINPRLDHKHIISTYGLVISLHCRKIFPPILVGSVRCINVHPGYNPHNRGLYPHVWSIINGLPAGVTIHEMDEGIDTGPIIYAEQEVVLPNDTSETLYNRIIDREMVMIDKYLDDLIQINYTTFSHGKGNYNSMEDFKRLCEIDQLWFDKLRALSHGDYRNAHSNGTYFKLQIHESSNPTHHESANSFGSN